MKRTSLIVFLFLYAASSQAGIYISVTASNFKKAKLALTHVHPLSGATVGQDILDNIDTQVHSDLELANLFEFVPQDSFADLDQAKDLYSPKYDEWTAKGVAFVIKLGAKIEGSKLVLEALLFDIPGQKKIFGTRYSYPLTQYYRVVHAMAEDVLKQLSGEKGLFFSRIAMVCRGTGSRKNSKEVYVVDPDGRNLTQLTSDNTLTLSPSWSPDSKYLLYTQYTTARNGKRGTVLKRHSLATGERKALSSREGMNSGAAWSPKGDRIAITLSFNGRPEIYFINPNGIGDPVPFSRNLNIRRVGGDGFQTVFAATLFDVEPSWSPDASKIVFSSARTGNPMIFTVDVGSKIGNQLTFAGKYNATPAWSPKGDKIVFAAQRLAEGNFDLYLIDPDGNNLTRLTAGERSSGRSVSTENPSWAPTGRHLTFFNNEGGSNSVYVMTMDGTVKRKISPEGRDCTEPSWSNYEG